MDPTLAGTIGAIVGATITTVGGVIVKVIMTRGDEDRKDRAGKATEFEQLFQRQLDRITVLEQENKECQENYRSASERIGRLEQICRIAGLSLPEETPSGEHRPLQE